VPVADDTEKLKCRQAADALLEATVLLSWSNLGFRARQAMWGWGNALPAGSMEGRNAVVTGGTNGLGKAAATELVRAGARVCLVGRDPSRARLAVEEVLRAAQRALDTCSSAGLPATCGTAWAESADMAFMSDVRALADRLLERMGRLDALVHAAGGIVHHYELVDGAVERTVATNVTGPHLLTALLEPLLAAGAPSNVVWVSSGGAYLQPLSVDLLRATPLPYRGTVAYARAKRAQIALARQWATRLEGQRTACTAMHPGWAATDGLSRGLPRFTKLFSPLLRTTQEGSDTLSWLAGGQAGPQPKVAFWLDRLPRAEHKSPLSLYPPQEETRLWEWCCEVTGAPGKAPARGAA
jgi:dehydrogenase/reductase SDR family protein 12